jgi:hypothetical protein
MTQARGRRLSRLDMRGGAAMQSLFGQPGFRKLGICEARDFTRAGLGKTSELQSGKRGGWTEVNVGA